MTHDSSIPAAPQDHCRPNTDAPDMITAASFPTPALALRGGRDDETRAHVFSRQEAKAAQGICTYIAERLPRYTVRRDRTDLLRHAHRLIREWRLSVASQAPGRLGVGLPLDLERFRTSLRTGGPNYDRLGDIGRLRAGATWNDQSRTYEGGEPTPASEIMLAYAQATIARFDHEQADDELVNLVQLPNGRTIAGNRLVRGDAARQLADELLARAAARGQDTSRMEIGGEPIYAVTAAPDEADIMFNNALYLLADAPALDLDDRFRAWQAARYLLYQAPRTKKGSDAVTRVFLVATGTLLFGIAPTLEQDVDLRCMVLGQSAATAMPRDGGVGSARR